MTILGTSEKLYWDTLLPNKAFRWFREFSFQGVRTLIKCVCSSVGVIKRNQILQVGLPSHLSSRRQWHLELTSLTTPNNQPVSD